VGGRGTLVGAALGALLVNYAKSTSTTGFLAPYWLFALGALFVFVTIFLPRGVLGLLPRRGGPRADAGAAVPYADAVIAVGGVVGQVMLEAQERGEPRRQTRPQQGRPAPHQLAE
jgi:hypothetical protein